MKTFAYLAFVITLLALACKPTPSPDPSPKPTPTPLLLDTLWSRTLGSGIPLQLNSQGDVLLSNRLASGFPEPVLGVDGATGKLKFTWQDYLQANSQLYPGYYLFQNNYLLLADQAHLGAIHTLTGQTAWKLPAGAYTYGSILGSNPSGQCYQGQSKQDYLLEVFEIALNSGQKTLLLNVYDSTQQYKHIRLNLLQWGKNSQDQACLFLNLQYSHPLRPNETYQRQLCYNLVQQKIVWEYAYSGILEQISAYAAHKFYVGYYAAGLFYVQCYDTDHGKLLWQQSLGEQAYQKLWVHQNHLVAVPWGAEPVKAFDLQTGAEQWTFSLEEPKHANFLFWNESSSYHAPYLFAAYGKHLLVLNLQTGQEVYYQPIGFEGSSFYKGVAVNPNTRTLYVNDIRTLRCYKLPKEVVF
jgi:outer membrane protein assembly factor BamB